MRQGHRPCAARGAGANVIVTEVDSLRALEAVMDGYRVMPMAEAAAQSDFIVSATGDKHVIDEAHFRVMEGRLRGRQFRPLQRRDQHPRRLEEMAVATRQPRAFIDEYETRRTAAACAWWEKGRLVNLAAAERPSRGGHGHEFRQPGPSAPGTCTPTGENWKRRCTRCRATSTWKSPGFKLAAMGVKVDTLSEEQESYLTSWQEGT